jgi:hypothetical protein
MTAKRNTNLKSDLTCSYCSLIFKDPIELPCQDLICNEHLSEKEVIKNKKIICRECKKECQLNEIECRSNNFAQKFVENKQYLNEEEINMKKKLEESIVVFYRMYEEIPSNINELEMDCHNQFKEIRFQLDEHREKLKGQIDNIYMEMIEKTKSFEVIYLSEFKEKTNDLIKTFEQDEDLQIIQSISKIKDHLKRANKFQPNLSFQI